MAIPQLFVVQVEDESPIQNSQPETTFFYGDHYFLSEKENEWQNIPYKGPITMFDLFCNLHGKDASPINYVITLNGKQVSGSTVIDLEDYVEMYRI